MITSAGMDCGPQRILCCCSRTHGSIRRVSADSCRHMLLQAEVRHGMVEQCSSRERRWRFRGSAVGGGLPCQWSTPDLDSSVGVRGRPGVARTALRCEASPQCCWLAILLRVGGAVASCALVGMASRPIGSLVAFVVMFVLRPLGVILS
jgi:hypothetical protein